MAIDVQLLPPQARAPGVVTSSDVVVPVENDEILIRCNFDNGWNSPRSQRAIKLIVEMAIDGNNFVPFASFEAGGFGMSKAQIEAALGAGSADPFIVIPLIAAYRGKRVRVKLETRATGNTNARLIASTQGHPDNPGGPPNSVAFDAVASAGAGNVASLSWTHTPSGTPTGVAISANNLALSGTDTGLTDVTYGGASVGDAIVSSSQQLDTTLTYYMQAHIFGQASPAAGAQTVLVTFSGSGRYSRIGSVSVVGGHATILHSASGAANGANPNDPSLVIASRADELVFDAILAAINTPNMLVGAGQTQRYVGNAGVASIRGHGSTEPGAASVTMDWPGGTPTSWVQAAISFRVLGNDPEEPAAAEGGDQCRTRCRSRLL